LAEPLAIEDTHFVDCICTGGVPDEDGWDGLSVVAVLEAIDQSLRTGQAVKVDANLARSRQSRIAPTAASGVNHE